MVCAWMALAAWLAPAAAIGQTTTGTILGEVKDSTGGTLPGVTVTAVNQANGLTREAVTDGLGNYRFSAMPAGLYTVKASLTGFKEATRTDVRLAINSQVAAPFTLEVGGLEETITVTEQAPLVNTTENVVRTLVDTQQIASLPLKSRDFLDLTLLAPGVVADQGSASGGQTDSISFGGMSENYKSIWLEGVDFNDEVTGGGSSLSSATRIALAQEAIQEFQVMANSYSAEFGRSASGAVNILTKSGGNQVRGAGFYFRRDDAFDKPNYFAEIVPPFKIEQYGATLGGPIKQNKLFYFASWEKRANNRSVQVNIPVAVRDFVSRLGYDTRTDIPVTTSENNVFGKVTYLASQKHTLNGTYMYDHRDLFNQQTGGDSAGDHGYDDQRRAWFFVGNLTSVLRSNVVNELRVSGSHQALDRVLPAGSTSKPEIRFPTVQFGRASNVPQSRTQDNYIVTNATSVNFVAKGTHDLKFGFEMNKVPTTSLINQSFNGLFEFLQDRPVVPGDPTSLPFRYTQGVELRGELAALTRDVDIYSAFINNQWQPRSNVTINIGVRYDWQARRPQRSGRADRHPDRAVLGAPDHRRPARPELQGRAERPEQHRAAPRPHVGSDERRPHGAARRLRYLLRPDQHDDHARHRRRLPRLHHHADRQRLAVGRAHSERLLPEHPDADVPRIGGHGVSCRQRRCRSALHAPDDVGRDTPARHQLRGVVRLRLHARRALPADAQRERPPRR
jgi:hypothetical protein